MLDPQTFQERATLIIILLTAFTGFNTALIVVLVRIVGQLNRQEKK